MSFRVTAERGRGNDLRQRIAERDKEPTALRAANPRRAVEEVRHAGFGAGRNVRFGDLDGDGQLDMLIAQNVPKVRGDAFDHISASPRSRSTAACSGSRAGPIPRNGLLTNDTPFQIHDLDGDGGQTSCWSATSTAGARRAHREG